MGATSSIWAWFGIATTAGVGTAAWVGTIAGVGIGTVVVAAASSGARCSSVVTARSRARTRARTVASSGSCRVVTTRSGTRSTATATSTAAGRRFTRLNIPNVLSSCIQLRRQGLNQLDVLRLSLAGIVQLLTGRMYARLCCVQRGNIDRTLSVAFAVSVAGGLGGVVFGILGVVVGLGQITTKDVLHGISNVRDDLVNACTELHQWFWIGMC